jgi:chromosome segregation ATPase
MNFFKRDPKDGEIKCLQEQLVTKNEQLECLRSGGYPDREYRQLKNRIGQLQYEKRDIMNELNNRIAEVEYIKCNYKALQDDYKRVLRNQDTNKDQLLVMRARQVDERDRTIRELNRKIDCYKMQVCELKKACCKPKSWDEVIWGR